MFSWKFRSLCRNLFAFLLLNHTSIRQGVTNLSQFTADVGLRCSRMTNPWEWVITNTIGLRLLVHSSRWQLCHWKRRYKADIIMQRLCVWCYGACWKSMYDVSFEARYCKQSCCPEVEWSRPDHDGIRHDGRNSRHDNYDISRWLSLSGQRLLVRKRVSHQSATLWYNSLRSMRPANSMPTHNLYSFLNNLL